MKPLNLSVTICTLNEEANIAACLAAIKINRPREIIVIDGGSTDKTIKIAGRLADKVIKTGRKGLAYQRQKGVETAKGKYIALIDADHRPEPGCFERLIKEMEKEGYDGIEAQILSVFNKGYWDWAMEQNFKLTHNLPGPRIMIGTPCIYKVHVLKKIKFDPFFTGPSDDTDLCYRLVKAGYKLGVGTPTVRQEHRTDFNTFTKKWIWYGRGDAQFAFKHPERAASIIKHELFNYPVRKSFTAIKQGQFKVIPFFILCGWLRHFGFILEMPKLITGGKKTIVKT